MKPQNVMLGDDGHVKVMDFGIAHLMDSDTLTGDGDVIGTIAYMSPEQAAGRRVQPPTDVYSAGMVLYELLAGAHPLRGDTPAETLSNVAGARLPSLATLRPDLPDDLITLVDAACAPRPAERPTPAYLSEAFDDLLRSGRLQARRLQKARRLVRPLGRAAEVAERAGGAALAAVTSAVVLGALPAYPQSWTLPLVAVSAAVWAVVPEAGLAFLLGSLAFPLFNVSLSAGAAYLVFAVAVFLIARARPITALWPAFALVLTPAYLTLLAPAAAALLGRIRGPLTAAWAGAGTVLFLLLTRAQRGPFTSGAAALARRPGRRGRRRPVHRRRPRARARAGGADAAAGRRLGRPGGGPGLCPDAPPPRAPSLDLVSLVRRRVRGVPHRAGGRLALPREPVAARVECGRARCRDTLAAGPDHRRSTGGK